MVKSPPHELAPIPQGLRPTGTRSDRRPQYSWPAKEFRILSIDGGGIRGIQPASLLAECERHFTNGKSVGDYFDMIAGTSTGGIMALGLGKGMTAKDILDIYLNKGGDIFPSHIPAKSRQRRWLQFKKQQLRDLASVRYSPEALKQALLSQFGNQVLGESKRRLVIPTFDDKAKVNVLKTPHHRDFQIDWTNQMVDVALATSAAPTYFPAHPIGTELYVDGGVWANNPIMLALVDALTCYDLDRHDVRILSLGCGSGEHRVTDKQAEGGQLAWANLIHIAMDLASQNADGQAGLLIGRDRLLRIDTPDQTRPIALDDYAKASSVLPSVAKALFKRHKDKLSEFFVATRPVFDAFYGPRAS